MATKSWTRVYQTYYDIEIYECTLDAGDDSDPLVINHHQDNSVQVSGTFAGTTVTVKGANNPTTPSYVALKDAFNVSIALTAEDIRQILPGPYQYKVDAAGGAASGLIVTVKLAR